MAGSPLPQFADGDVHGLRRAVEELTLLNDLALAISTTTDLDEIIAMIVTRATGALKAQEVVLTMVDQTGMNPTGTVFRRAEPGRSEHFHLSRNLLGCMCHERQALLINDVASDPRLRGVPLPGSLRNLMCVPLTVGAKLIAVLSACNKRDGTDFEPYDLRLLSIMAAQSAQVLDRARLLKDEADNAQLKRDLLVAQNIQTCLLPATSPEVAGYDIAGASVPARLVSGDYYDFIPTGEDTWGITLGDVSGKGIPAALLMSNLQAMLRGQAPLADSCSRFIQQCNRQLFHSTPLNKFATLFYGVLDKRRHTFTYCNAGHESPCLFRAGQPVQRMRAGGLALGVLAEADYRHETVSLARGDTMVMFSDGVTDVLDCREEPFGEDRLLGVLEQAQGQSAAQMISTITAALDEYAGDEPAVDDLTLVVVRRNAD